MKRWKKLGQLVVPTKDVPWMASHAGPSFVDIVDGKVWVYVTGRDLNNVSRIGLAEVKLAGEKHELLSISRDVIFDIGELGTFDESGVSYPWLVKHDGKIYMYYAGWVSGGRNRFQNFTGLAVSKDGGKSFQRVKRVPILDRTDQEPFGSGSCAVFIEDGLWKMYYTAFEPWEAAEGKNRPVYNLKYAYSQNGIDWVREQKVVVGFKDPGEHIIGKPMVLKENGIYKLWYSHRGPAYRIGYAESKDGLSYVRKDEEVGITVGPEAWDREMICYAYVFDYSGRRYMIYNGNDFGKTGLGIAIQE
jgi:hypothetical protein